MGMEHVGIEKARTSLGEIVNRAHFGDDPTVITRHGVPAAVVISVKWYEAALAADPRDAPQAFAEERLILP